MIKKILAISAALVAIYFLMSVPTVQKKFLYPFPYRSTVESYSARWKVDKFLAIAVMKVESNFSEAAHSQSGAVGLMQIMPETAAWIAYQLGEQPEEASEDIKNLRSLRTSSRAMMFWHWRRIMRGEATFTSGLRRIIGTKIFQTLIRFPTLRPAITLNAFFTAAKNMLSSTARTISSQRPLPCTNCALPV